MKVLVTGGAGFIGSHLVERLVEKHDVVVLDNLSRGKKEYVDKKAKFIHGDIRDMDNIRTAMKGCSVVFHLAAQTDLRSADEDLIYQTNFLGSKNVFTVAAENGAKIIFTSSAAVYGNAKVSTNENAECKPISQYGKTKLKSERFLNGAFIARLFNVYGPRGNSVINKFCKKIPAYEDITVFGNGLQTRDYICVSDVIDALMLGIDNSGSYNVGTGTETTILNIIDIIHHITKNKPHVKFSIPIENEIHRSRADITKIKKELRWEPKIKIDRGIRMVLQAEGIKIDY